LKPGDNFMVRKRKKKIKKLKRKIKKLKKINYYY